MCLSSVPDACPAPGTLALWPDNDHKCVHLQIENAKYLKLALLGKPRETLSESCSKSAYYFPKWPPKSGGDREEVLGRVGPEH